MSALEPAQPTSDQELETALLPPRRRRRLTLLTAVLAFAAVAGGAFAGGVEIQKHYGGSSNGSGAGTSGRLARFGSGSSSNAGTGTGLSGRSGSTGGGGAGSGGASGFGGGGSSGATGFGGGGFGGAGDTTLGQVTVIKGSTLYVTDFNGNTVKVTTSAQSRVSKTVTSSLKNIHPGDSVVVRGTTGKNGTLAASSISVSSGGNG
jgi:hypothetical protein